MSWKQRGGRRYYYRSSGAKRAYFGRGAAAQDAAQHDDAKRKLRAHTRAEMELTRRQFLSADVAVRSFVHMAAAMTQGMLVAAGYHRHDRGDWRRRQRNPN